MIKKSVFVFFSFILIFSSISVFAINEFTFSATDTYSYVEVQSGSAPVDFITNKSFTLRIEFTGSVGSNLVVNKISGYSGWSGTESIGPGGKQWILTNVPVAGYSFRAEVGESGGGVTAVATINVDVDPAITSITHTCTPSSRVVLNWTAIPGVSWYEVSRNGTVISPLGSPTTNSYQDTTVAQSTTYLYTIRGVQSSGLYVDDPAIATITTGSCVSCGDGINQTSSGEQCDNGNQNGVQCTAPYGGECMYCSNSCTLILVDGGNCTDGILQTPQEQCDDGNTNNNDACTNLCKNSVCGDSIIRTGIETCDDGNTANGDGCSSICQVEPGQCVFTSAAWSTASTVEGTTVNLNVVGVNCTGKSVSFVVWEDDLTGDDPVSVNPSNVVFSGNTATGTWTAEWQNDISGDPEYYFIATQVGNSSVTRTSGLLSVSPLVQCGNGVINSGEQCDNGAQNGACPATCSSSCTINNCGGASGFCGDGLCNSTNNNETYLTCSQDCPAPSCQLTSAAWSSTQRTEGQTVNLNVQGTNCNGQTVSFIVEEYDFGSSPDPVTVNPTSVLFNGNSATGTWTTEWQNDGPLGGDPEYYFIANVAGTASLSSGTGGSQLLTVNQSAPGGLQCSSIATCGNYPDAASCNGDICGVAANSVPSGVDCNDPNIDCSCMWNVTSGTCFARVGGIAGNCAYTQQTTDDCGDGFLTFSWTASWTWLPEKGPADDPEGLYLQCVSGSKIVECPAQIALPFFSFYNLIVAVIIIGLVYWVLAMRKSSKRSVSKRKK